ncbi:MAG: hypothetical protein H0T42_05035 [Deltaproteobacteria bacterium]|nr:hypothetical protein [Deltaproteobacteria bacterium]
MRTLLLMTGLSLLTTVSACTDSAGELKDPPVLKVTSPQRSLIQDRAGVIVVTGTVTPNEISGERIEKVLVNNVQATVAADGSFTAAVQVQPGATLLHTTARDAAGQEANDTRSIHAGELRPVGANIENAITAAVSKEAFAKMSAAAGPMIEGIDMAAMLAPLQPMVHMGDETGEDCAFARMYVDDVNMANAEISLIPTNAGLQFRAQIDGLDIPGRARYSVACLDGSNTLRIKATRVVVGGTLVVTANGTQGFKTTLTNETVQITGLDIQASGLPGSIINLLRLDTAAGFIISKAMPFAMEPMMNKALGGLSGPQTMNVMGKSLIMEVDPTTIDINSDGALVTLSTKVLLAGSESSRGFIFTDNGMPTMDAGTGMQIGLADDLANEMMAEVTAIGMLNLEMPAHGGTFDTTKIAMTLPPMVSADPADGKMKVILGDMMATFMNQDVPVAKAAISAAIELQIVPASNGYGIAVQLGTPVTHVDVLDDVVNTSRLTEVDLARATEVCLAGQITAISKLLTSIPLPAVAGVQMRNMSIGSDDGYVMVRGDIE